MPLFFDSNWTFKCTTTINPTRCFADHATIFASQMRHTTRDARTKDLDESRAEKGGEAAASFTKCQGEFVFLVGNVTDSNCFGGEKDVRMQLHSEVLCEILRMTSFDKGMMDSWGVKDWKLQVVIRNLAVIYRGRWRIRKESFPGNLWAVHT